MTLNGPNTERKEFWEAKRKKTTEIIDENDFEESRRCLFTSYHSYVQTHAGYIIALTMGFFTVISAFDKFLSNGVG